MIGTGVVDAQLELEGFDFSGADRWHVLILYGGRPAARVEFPSPGVGAGGELVRAALLRRADAEHARIEMIDRLRRRLGGPPPPPAPQRFSVVVCTHRRSHYLPDILRSLGQLSPQPFEVIIVDNDPGTEDCREMVERAGFRYLREDRRGLDNARNAGLLAAQGDVVVFTDDDVVLSPAWLAPLDRAFEHEGVVAVTGPAYPYQLDTPARVRMEHQASLARGFGRVSFDWQVISPLHAAAMGVGANMAIRRSRLLELGEQPFPPELDAGTETESGGDTYVLSRLLASGGRVVYEPEMFVFHQHRPDGPALRRAVLGYGIGLSASLTKLVVEDRELTAPRAWLWLVKQYLKTQMRRAVGRADAVETRVSWDYLRGGFLGIARWRRALATQAASRAGEPGGAAPGLGEQAAGEPLAAASEPPVAEASISVIIPTFRREEALRRSLSALAAQDVASGTFEVIVVDDDREAIGERASRDRADRYPFKLRRVRNAGRGAAAARNHGTREATAPLLLFLDDDIVADPWLVRRHLRWHGEHPDCGVLVGSFRPRPTRGNLAATVARLWWQDVFDLLEEAQGMTFVCALTANMSTRRAAFVRIGEFSEDYARARREDWEWGLRLLKAGVPVAFDRAASARHEFTLETAQRLRDSRREGFGDTLIAADHPEALASLPLPSMRTVTRTQPIRLIGFWLWRQAAVQRLVVRTLDLLELGNLRETWVRLFRLAQRAAYAQGVYEGGWRASDIAASGEGDQVELELLSDRAVEAPEVAAPTVRVLIQGKEVALVSPAEGIWAPSLAEQIADAMEPQDIARAAALGGWLTSEDDSGAQQRKVEVIFGPANPPSDQECQAELEDFGALVRVAEGDPGRHWESVADAAREGTRPLVAFPLPGTSPGPAWLADALAAFDGGRVGLVFGGRLDPPDPPDPLYLHDRRSTGISLVLGGPAPAYLVVRRELVPGLGDAGGLLDSVVAVVRGALEEGWVIGHRSVRGLQQPSYAARERGEAYGRIEARNAAFGAGGTRVLARETTRGTLTLGWQALKQHGRLTVEQREIAAGIARGAFTALRRERRRGR